jgi:hypothetical protein
MLPLFMFALLALSPEGSLDGFTSPKSPAPSSPLGIPSSSNSSTSPMSSTSCVGPFRKSAHQSHFMRLTLPFFSYSYALFCTTQNHNSFRFIFFRTLCTKHPGWGIPRFSAISVHSALEPTRAHSPADPFVARHLPLAAIPFKIRTSAKRTRSPFRMNTSETKDLKLFRMNTYEKKGRGGGDSRAPLVAHWLSFGPHTKCRNLSRFMRMRTICCIPRNSLAQPPNRRFSFRRE